ncbi:MAG: hypothetical protein ACOZBZ_04405 [Patescibacteria group bacterium]
MEKKNKNRLNFTFRVIKNGKLVERYETHSIRRFYTKIRRINWQNRPLKVYLRVSYGGGSYNDGEYTNKKDFNQVLSAFLEDY